MMIQGPCGLVIHSTPPYGGYSRPLRLLFAARPEILTQVLNVVTRALSTAVCEAHQRDKLERLCRYVSRGPIALERLSIDGDGLVGTCRIGFAAFGFAGRVLKNAQQQRIKPTIPPSPRAPPARLVVCCAARIRVTGDAATQRRETRSGLAR